MKKMLSILLCLLCVATACPLHAAAGNIPQLPAGYQPLFIGDFQSHSYSLHANRLWGSFAVCGQKADGTEIKLSEADYNIYCEVPLTVAEATLGAEIDIPTLEGNVKYSIPEGTQPGTKFTMRGKGVPYVNGNGRRGDLIFRVTVEIPKGLNDKQKDAMKAFAESCGEGNYAKHKQFFKKIFGK